MIETLRSFLYPVGLLANLLFSLRFIIQWASSEKKKKSITPKVFWNISLAADLIMVFHSLVQLQYPITLLQSMNGVMAWRNLNLSGKKPRSFTTTVSIMFAVFFAVTGLFLLQWLFFSEGFSFMRSPVKRSVEPFWHILGCFGMALFASRFWVQWYSAEQSKNYELTPAFWRLSVCGATCALLYFIRMGDLVNILAFGTGIIPYIRNIFLLKKQPQPVKGTIFVFAGEKSGDVLGGELLTAYRKLQPSTLFYGVGGEKMEKAGANLLLSLQNFQVMGVSAVIKKLPGLLANFYKVKNFILKTAPEAVVLIDYADFNMRLAKSLRKSGYKGKVIQYVCPSVWAWRKKRVKALSKSLDLILSILPFEKSCFLKEKPAVKYIGHPLVQAIQNHPYEPNWKEQFSVTRPYIALFPGSRLHVIESNLPAQLKACKELSSSYQILVSVADPKLEEKIRTLTKPYPEVRLIPAAYRYEMMREAHSALATCGTVVLELGLHEVPTIVTYGLTPLNYYVGRYLFKILLPAYSLPNIILEEPLFPEFIHKELDLAAITTALHAFTNDTQERTRALSGCQKLKTLLFEKHASTKAAEAILEITNHAMPLP